VGPTQGGETTSAVELETLVEKLDHFDFAILVLTPDDLTESRRKKQQTPRDNVLLELGMFIAGIGRRRTFVVYDRIANMKVPTDLAGVTCASFQQHKDGNLPASVGAACTQIKHAVEEQGLRKRESKTIEIDRHTQFQMISDLLELVSHQFFILMHEKNLSVRRESNFFEPGIRFEYINTRRSNGAGEFSVNSFCQKLADAGLLQIDLRQNVTLTPRGHEFAQWLLDNGKKVEYFHSNVGSWGNKPEGFEVLSAFGPHERKVN
jgi:hypothetical protein